MVADKAAEILSSVCSMARERKQLVLQPGIAAQAPAENAVVSSISTLRATVTGG
jgi:inositol hexakisphosphate/diphosphoinositol-pentakisphosphate kinase